MHLKKIQAIFDRIESEPEAFDIEISGNMFLIAAGPSSLDSFVELSLDKVKSIGDIEHKPSDFHNFTKVFKIVFINSLFGEGADSKFILFWLNKHFADVLKARTEGESIVFSEYGVDIYIKEFNSGISVKVKSGKETLLSRDDNPIHLYPSLSEILKNTNF